MKSILYINRNMDDANVEKTKKVKRTALLHKVRVLTKKEDEGSESGENALETLPDNAEMLMFCGFTQNELSRFLYDLKKLGVRIDLKCMETETNKGWTLKKLYEELKVEHESLHPNLANDTL